MGDVRAGPKMGVVPKIVCAVSFGRRDDEGGGVMDWGWVLGMCYGPVC